MFAQDQSPDFPRQRTSGLWAVPVSSSLVDFNGRGGVVNPWTNALWHHPGGMDFDERSGNLFVALQGSKYAVGVISTEAVRGFVDPIVFGGQHFGGTLVDVDTDLPCSSLGEAQPSCFTIVRNPDGNSYEAWAYLVTEDMASYTDRLAWIAIDPRDMPCADGASSCIRLYSIPFMNYAHSAPGFGLLRDAPVFIDVYEWTPSDGLSYLGDASRLRVQDASGQQLTAGDFGNGHYQGGKVSRAGKLYVVSDGKNTDERPNDRDSKSDRAVVVAELPDVPAPGDAASTAALFVGTHRVNVDVSTQVGSEEWGEELEDLALWDLDALRRERPELGIPSSMTGQIHVVLVDSDLYTDNWYFKHLRLDEGCRAGSFKFWEGTNASQDEVCTVSAIDQHVDVHEGRLDCENDEAESVTMRYIPTGTKMRLYNDPDCDHSADWAELTVHQGIYIDTIDTFDRDESNAAYTFEWHDVQPGSRPSDRSLDQCAIHPPGYCLDEEYWELGGKVSCIQIDAP